MKIRYMAKSVSWQAGVQRLIGENAFESMMMKGMKLKKQIFLGYSLCLMSIVKKEKSKSSY